MSRAATVTAALVFLLTWGLTTHGKYSVTGDEPHYLMVTESLVADGDLDLANNYADDAGARFGASGLVAGPHVKPTRDGRSYPIHDIGVPILLAPIYVAATQIARLPGIDLLRRMRMNRGLFAYALISLALIVLCTAAARITIAGLQQYGATTGQACAVVAIAWLSPPVISNAFLVFPEPVALFVTACVVACAYREADWTRRDTLTVFALGLLPWMHRKFAPYAVALLAVIIWRRAERIRTMPRHQRIMLAAVFLGPSLVMAAWTLVVWGNLAGPFALNGMPLSLAELTNGIPATFVDRENGLFWWAPVCMLLPAAFWIDRERLWPWLVPIIALILPGAAHQWWAGFSPAGRFLVPLAPMASLFACGVARSRTLRTAAGLLLIPQVITTAYAWQHARLLWPQGDGENRVLAILLPPLGRIYRAIPSFRTAADEAWPATFVILLLIMVLNLVMIVGYVKGRNRRST